MFSLQRHKTEQNRKTTLCVLTAGDVCILVEFRHDLVAAIADTLSKQRSSSLLQLIKTNPALTPSWLLLAGLLQICG